MGQERLLGLVNSNGQVIHGINPPNNFEFHVCNLRPSVNFHCEADHTEAMRPSLLQRSFIKIIAWNLWLRQLKHGLLFSSRACVYRKLYPLDEAWEIVAIPILAGLHQHHQYVRI
jgi:hypothetical protein